MPSKNVRLKIRTQHKKNYTEVTASDGTEYYYKFTHGKTGRGNNNFKVTDGPEKESFSIVFSRKLKEEYKFVGRNGAFLNMQHSPDLSGKNTESKITVTDKCDTTGEWKYGVKVQVRGKRTTFECDPVIRNWR